MVRMVKLLPCELSRVQIEYEDKPHCIINKCQKKYYAKGFCAAHYHQYAYPKKPRKQKFCTVPGCGKKHYSLGLCRNHLSRQAPRPNITHGGAVVFLIFEHNPRWSGGVSYFRNHYWVKQNKKRLVEERGSKCQECNREVKGVYLHQHHIDGNKDNHEDSNIKLLCITCHGATKRGLQQIRLNNIKLWASIFQVKYDQLMFQLKKSSKETGQSRMTLLGWLIAAYYYYGNNKGYIDETIPYQTRRAPVRDPESRSQGHALRKV